MEILKSASKDAHEWMVREVLEVWARSFYNPRSKVNRMDNNMSEGFNNWIQEARDMPILTMFETIKRQLMARKWDVSGVPCNHTCAAILTHKGRPEDYVHPYYTRETFIKTYKYRINPLPDKTMWRKQPYDPIEPPPFRAKSSRPKKARRKGEDEPNNPFKKTKYSGQSSGTRGGRTRGAGTTSTSRGKAKAADPPQPQRALKRLKKVGEGWNSS
ncbi:hypothetical protein Vadar_006924 [Vaccinium darrowii]|uniref:Uncharacterized protein n=1 Tax=Vaccinium darrowii TaxID=229202 RepID=A0ACB7YD82_9ERIC|nr:hypothetical protein Vadar_006924 [Vaccinium darrowii]